MGRAQTRMQSLAAALFVADLPSTREPCLGPGRPVGKSKASGLKTRAT
jgi:hypothetical protein